MQRVVAVRAVAGDLAGETTRSSCSPLTFEGTDSSGIAVSPEAALRRRGCGILKMVATTPQRIGSKRAAVFFGTVLCLLLAFFAVERRVAAYPPHNVSATVTAATGVQKPEQISFTEPPSVQAPLLFACVVALFAVFASQWVRSVANLATYARFPDWAPAPLAVRPPPTF